RPGRRPATHRLPERPPVHAAPLAARRDRAARGRGRPDPDRRAGRLGLRPLARCRADGGGGAVTGATKLPLERPTVGVEPAAGEEAIATPCPASCAVEARGLVKFYGTTAALRGCDLSVAWGERVALVGPNGAGKTTLLKVLATLVRPSAGRLALLGLYALRHPAAARGGLGVVAHETYLYRDLTAAENLALYGRLYGLDCLERRIAAGLARVGLAGLGPRRVSTLSRGQQQRLALARALLHEP